MSWDTFCLPAQRAGARRGGCRVSGLTHGRGGGGSAGRAAAVGPGRGQARRCRTVGGKTQPRGPSWQRPPRRRRPARSGTHGSLPDEPVTGAVGAPRRACQLGGGGRAAGGWAASGLPVASQGTPRRAPAPHLCIRGERGVLSAHVHGTCQGAQAPTKGHLRALLCRRGASARARAHVCDGRGWALRARSVELCGRAAAVAAAQGVAGQVHRTKRLVDAAMDKPRRPARCDGADQLAAALRQGLHQAFAERRQLPAGGGGRVGVCGRATSCARNESAPGTHPQARGPRAAGAAWMGLRSVQEHGAGGGGAERQFVRGRGGQRVERKMGGGVGSRTRCSLLVVGHRGQNQTSAFTVRCAPSPHAVRHTSCQASSQPAHILDACAVGGRWAG